MTRSRKTATSPRTPASAEATARKPAAAAPAAGIRLSGRGAFVLNACFVAGLLVLSQLSLLQQRPTLRASVVAAALFLLAWSGLLFGVLRRGQNVALAFSVINRHFDVADFLLEHGADINTNWNSHQPASILHELVFHDNYDSMRFLIDRGIDMTIKDYCWNSTAQGWALYGKQDQQMAQWLEDAERQREQVRERQLFG